MLASDLCKGIPDIEHAYLERFLKMSVTILALMPIEQRMREYAKAELTYAHLERERESDPPMALEATG